MEKLKIKAVSSLEKCFFDERIEDKQQIDSITVLKNERVAFAVLLENPVNIKNVKLTKIKLGGSLAKHAKLFEVLHVPSMMPMNPLFQEGAYLRRTPGMYPDLIRPLHYDGCIMVIPNNLVSLWIEVDLPKDVRAGEYDITVSAELPTPDGSLFGDTGVKVSVLDATLPKQTLIHTEWFYTDCLANYYHTRVFSERHWRIIEKFMRIAAENGVNMILTPVFTPELDTYVGGERLTTQLVDISLDGEGKYHFEFSKLHRWIDMALDCGIEYFEIPHFFTQWGAEHAPKIIVNIGGKKVKKFGWHTDAMGADYESFLAAFIPALITEFCRRGLDGRCYFHVSDEPRMPHLEQYTKCRKLLTKYLGDYPLVDALSNYEFYESGALDRPIPHTRDIAEFIERGVPHLWAYYCQSGRGVSDRFFSMPSWRTRMIGVQLYYYDIEGFLHWGFNYYNNWRSYNAIDPFFDSTGEYFVTSGDTYLVYPGENDTPWGSLRLNAMSEAMDDIRALKLYEEKYGKKAAKALILENTDGELTFFHYPENPDYLPNWRKKIYDAL